MDLRCAECHCAPRECAKHSYIECKNCPKGDGCCCCISFHKQQITNGRLSSLLVFLRQVKGFYAAALGIEILCITAAEIGENTGLYLLGFNPSGIAIAYVMGYALAGFTTFITILGRYDLGSPIRNMCKCCSVLEQGSNKGFIFNLRITFRNFAVGLKRLSSLYKQPSLGNILKTSLVIMITADSVSVLKRWTLTFTSIQYCFQFR